MQPPHGAAVKSVWGIEPQNVQTIPKILGESQVEPQKLFSGRASVAPLLTDMKTNPSLAARSALLRHPVAVDCVRAATALFDGQADIAIFESDRAFVVASDLVDRVSQPRPLTTSEMTLVAGTARLETAEDQISVAIVAPTGETIGAITVVGAHESAHGVPLQALARIIGGVVRDQTAANTEHAEAILEGLRDSVVILDADFTITWCNRAVGSLLGVTPAELIGTSSLDLLHPDDIESALHTLVRMAEGLEVYRLKVRLRNASGDFVQTDVTGLDHTDDPTIGGFVLSVRNAERDTEVTMMAEREKRMSEAIVRGLSDGIIATDSFGAVTMVNDVAHNLFSLETLVPSQVVLGDLHLLDLDGNFHALPSIDDPRPSDIFVVVAEGAPRYVTVSIEPVRDPDDVALGSVFVFHDVTKERLAVDELRSQALHDQLTGLANRRQLEQRLKELRASAFDITVAACFIDLDGFKLVNDQYGHRAGDELIRLAASRLAFQLRDQDLLVRQGGDEFVALLVDIDSVETVKSIAERLRDSLEDPYRVGEERFDISASIGVSIFQSENLDEERILQQADLALYAAKNKGRNRVEVFDSALAEASSTESQQRRLLSEAIDEDRLLVHFQPLVDSVTNRTKGYEALVRIETDTGGFLGPSSFLETISETYRMWELDQIAFSKACHGAALLEKLAPFDPPYVACNFSPVSIAQPDFVSVVTETVQAAKLRPSQICIEITESAAFDAGPMGLQSLTALADAGFPLSLDDFGTGYSSLAHLRDLPISSVKVDRSFVAKLTQSASERAIVAAIVTLAHDLGLRVVAEGVETLEQAQLTSQLGFETLQGWYFAPALTLTECINDWATRGANTLDSAVQRPHAA